MPRMKNGELFAVGYYGSRLFTSCYGIRGESSDPVVVIHHGNFVNCQNYVLLQQRLWDDHQQPSCCVERAGFGYSPVPDLATKIDLVAETKEILQALEQALDSRKFIHLGHSAGASYAWQATVTGRSWSQGLILLDGCTKEGTTCQEGEQYFSRRAKMLQSPVTQWKQRLGLRRWLQMASSYEGIILPSGPTDAVERAKQQGLTDATYFAQSEAAIRTPAIMAQLKQSQNSLPAAYISSDSKATTRASRTKIPRCLIKLSRESLKRYFKNTLLIQSANHDHFDMVNDAKSVMTAVRHITNFHEQKKG
jgi:pimeloyl-ACP methyl ester carboxylesterase